MESERIEYSKKWYRESPSSEKKIKFSYIQDDLTLHFPTAYWNARIVSETVRAAFPRSESKITVLKNTSMNPESSSSAMVLQETKRRSTSLTY